MLRLGLAPPPKVYELRTLIERERDERIAAPLVTVFGIAISKDHQDPQEVFEILLPLAKHKNQSVAYQALRVLLDYLKSSVTVPPQLIRGILSVVLTPPTDAGRVSLFLPLLSRLASDNIELGIEIIEIVSLKAEGVGISGQGRRDIFNRWSPAVQELVRRGGPDVVNRLLDMVPLVDRHAGRMIVEAAYRKAFHTARPKLDHLLTSDTVSAEVKDYILTNNYYRRGPVDSDGWVDLYSLLHNQGL